MEPKPERKQGLYWHVHHGILIEWCYNYDERVNFIRTDKPKNERATRLRLFKPVTGTLPKEVMKAGKAYDKTRGAYDKVLKACDKAWKACRKARKACPKVAEARSKARKAYDKAWEVCEKAGDALDKALLNNMPMIKKLHTKECPRCPWNGKTIFPNAQ